MIEPTWKHGETKRLIEQHFGLPQAHRAIRASNSAHWKLVVASYHASEIQEIRKAVVPTHMETIKKILLHASGSKKATGYIKSQFMTEAHLIACAQALHSIGDIMSHVIWYGTGLGSAAPDKTRISLGGVISVLKTQGTAPGVTKALECLRNSEAFAYLTAYVNTTKHRRLIDSHASASMDSSEPHYGFRIDSFRYEGIEYPKTWFDTLAEQYRNFVQDTIVNIGNTLNEWLSNQTSGITRV